MCPSYGLPGRALACSTNWPPGARTLGGDDRDLDAELIGRAGLALADALDLRSMEGIQLPAALALLLRTDLTGARQRPFECSRQSRLAGNLAVDVAMVGRATAYYTDCSASLGESGSVLFGLVAAQNHGRIRCEWKAKAITVATGKVRLNGLPFALYAGSYTAGGGTEANHLREVLEGARLTEANHLP